MMCAVSTYLPIMHAKPLLLPLGLAAALISCGGGAGAGHTITGVAASGAAVVQGTVEVKCQVGSGTAQTESDGSYRLTIPGGAGPCLLRVVDPVTGIEFHSALERGAEQRIAHVTPLSDIVVASALGVDPRQAFANPAEYFERITPAALLSGINVARETAGFLGAPLSADEDPLKGRLQTATAEAQGSAIDRSIDALMAALATADQALSNLVNRVAEAASIRNPINVGGGNSNPIFGGTDGGLIGAPMPIGAIVQSVVTASALSGCPSVRTGRVWLIDSLAGGEPLAHELDLSTAPATLTRVGGVPVDIAPVGNEACAFSAGGKVFHISDNGMGIWQSETSFGVIVPMQPSVSLTAPRFTGQYAALGHMRASHSGTDFTSAAAFSFAVNAPGRPLVEGRQCEINTGSERLPGCSSLSNAFTLAFEATRCSPVLIDGSATGALRCTSAQTATGQTEAYLIGYQAGGSSSILLSLSNFPVPVGPTSVAGTGVAVLSKVTSAMVIPQVNAIAEGAFWETGYDPAGMPRFFSGPVAASTISRTQGSTKTYQQTRNGVTYTHYLDTPAPGLMLSRSANGGPMIRLPSPAGWTFTAEKVNLGPAFSALGDIYRVGAQVRKPTLGAASVIIVAVPIGTGPSGPQAPCLISQTSASGSSTTSTLTCPPN